MDRSPRTSPISSSKKFANIGFCEVHPQKWPPGRCAWPGGYLIYTRGGKKLASAPLPRKLKRFGLCAGNGYAALDV
jgi:hypothetical protein